MKIEIFPPVYLKFSNLYRIEVNDYLQIFFDGFSSIWQLLFEGVPCSIEISKFFIELKITKRYECS